eukprot:TRINITY_DN20952_c0_g1_i1.p1 TRINITY_DN20952_c0_g1~~TRINITY_DN20952_c0_g1_i1.p1  ORF type:complete len:490 (+),score=99.43 TRINITY_DN20952_c0_g1_i1:45-1514(+)
MPANLETEALLKKCHQEQVTRYWDELSENERKTLCEQVNEIEERVGCVALSELVGESSWTAEKQDNKEIEPANQKDLGVVGADSEETERWNTLGLQQIAESKAAVIVMAGGQGTRLGSTFPKGILGDSSVEGAKMDLPRGKSLFAFQAEKIKRLETLAKSAFPESNPSIAWLVMTSHATHDATKAYFEEQNYFGLESSQIRFFMQGRMPSLDQDGKILLAKKGDISMSPDGNGGIYTALQRSGTLDWMAARGVEWVQVYSVDNILIKVADPVFYGFCAARKVDAAAKTIPKKDASEAVGVFALRNQRYGVIEYSEIGAERAQETTPEGGLLYGAANPAIHCYSLKFLAGPALEYCKRGSIWHLAVKDIPTIEGPVKGIKLETFIFDAFAAADSFGLLQVDRTTEFSAIKNGDDKPRDTPKTASKDILSLHKSWLLAAGVQVGDRPVEISPLVSYAGEGLGDVAEKWELLTKGLGEGEPLVLDSKLMSSL